MHFLHGLLMVLSLHLITVTFLSQFSDLDLIVLVVADLSFVVFGFYPEGLNLYGQSLDLDALKNDNKIQFPR
jgi:hypothetical protein